MSKVAHLLDREFLCQDPESGAFQMMDVDGEVCRALNSVECDVHIGAGKTDHPDEFTVPVFGSTIWVDELLVTGAGEAPSGLAQHQRMR